jgi:nickel/cobalt exporter
MGLSFLYGIFHAAGPGHGKAVISSYLLANQETWLRGVALSFTSALLQAIVAVAVVGIAAALLNATAGNMNRAVSAIETVSYALIVVIGVRLMWVKARAFLAAARDHSEHDDHSAHSDARAHQHHEHHDHSHRAMCVDHDHHRHENGGGSAWGHAHAPEPQELSGQGGWRRGLSAVVAVGLRPCAGAILMLVFALAQGLFWVGVGSALMMGLGTFITVAMIATIAVTAGAWARHLAASGNGFGMLAMRGAEVAAAVLITAFGILLLCGYIVEERMVGF